MTYSMKNLAIDTKKLKSVCVCVCLISIRLSFTHGYNKKNEDERKVAAFSFFFFLISISEIQKPVGPHSGTAKGAGSVLFLASLSHFTSHQSRVGQSLFVFVLTVMVMVISVVCSVCVCVCVTRVGFLAAADVGVLACYQ